MKNKIHVSNGLKKNIMQHFTNCLLKAFIFCLIIFVFSSCSAQGASPVSPSCYYGFFVKAKNFLDFCIFLTNSGDVYWGQIISRLYYSYFTMARIVHISKTKKFDKVKHDVIWKQNKIQARNTFGYDLKHLRVFYDYDYLAENESKDITKNELHKILKDDKAFNELTEDLKKYIPKFYKNIDGKEEWIRKCNDTLDEIIDSQSKLKDLIQNK